MFKILNKQILAEGVKRLDVEAPAIAEKILPGQFVSVCPVEGDERIPLAVADIDPLKGTVSLIFNEIGYTTKKLGNMPIQEEVFSILGPLGQPAQIAKEGIVVCIATGVGIAQILPICRAFTKAGNKVIGIIGAKTKKDLMLQAQMRLTCYKLYTTTNDGTYERKGLATDVLNEILKKETVNKVYAIGSMDMMSQVCDMTLAKNIKTRVQLNPVMVDCMGLCGSCRVKIDGKMVLACLDGPEFDGHQVDFEDLSIRMNAFKGFDGWQESKKKESPASGSRTFMRVLQDFLQK